MKHRSQYQSKRRLFQDLFRLPDSLRYKTIRSFCSPFIILHIHIDRSQCRESFLRSFSLSCCVRSCRTRPSIWRKVVVYSREPDRQHSEEDSLRNIKYSHDNICNKNRSRRNRFPLNERAICRQLTEIHEKELLRLTMITPESIVLLSLLSGVTALRREGDRKTINIIHYTLFTGQLQYLKGHNYT